MRRRKIIRVGVVTAVMALGYGCGRDGRDLAERSSESPAASSGGSPGVVSPGELVLARDSHIALPTLKYAAASCGVEVNGDKFIVSGWDFGFYVTRTRTPLEEYELSEVTDSRPLEGVWLEACRAYAASDRIFVLWEGERNNERVTGGFLLDSAGRILAEDLGAAEGFWAGAELTAAAAREEELALLGRDDSSPTAVYLKQYEDGVEVSALTVPLAECDNIDLRLSLVPTSAGYSAAFVCHEPGSEVFESVLMVAFVSGSNVELQKVPLPYQRSDVLVGLAPFGDESVLVAYGAGLEGETSQRAVVLRFDSGGALGAGGDSGVDPGYEELGQIFMGSEGLELSSLGGGGLVLVARGEHRGEDAPPTRYIEYCFVDESGVPLEPYAYLEGENLHAFSDAACAIERHLSAPIIACTPWDRSTPKVERVLFDAGADVPRALHCSAGECEVAMTSHSDDPDSSGYYGFSFLDVGAVFEGSPDLGRTSPLSFSPNVGGVFGPSVLVNGFSGASVEVLSLWQGTGAKVLSFERDGYEIVSEVEGLGLFRPDLFREGDGYRVFGVDPSQLLTGFVDATGGLVMQPVVGAEWGEIFQCGSRYVNFTRLDELYVSADESATVFEERAPSELSFLSMLGCTDEFALLARSNSEPPLQLVSLGTGEITGVSGVERGQFSRASRVGDRLAVFRLSSDAPALLVVDEAGGIEERPLAFPSDEELAEYAPDGWGDEPFLVPEFHDDDLNHVSLIWAAESRTQYLSSWEFVEAPSDAD